MKTLMPIGIISLLLIGCASNDVASLSKAECIKLGFKYKVEKRLNFLKGAYEVRSFCYKSQE